MTEYDKKHLLGHHRSKLIDCVSLGNDCFKLIFADIQIKVKVRPLSENRLEYTYKYGKDIYMGGLITRLNSHYKK